MNSESQTTLDRVRSVISGDWARAEMISEAIGFDILTAPTVRRQTIHLRDMPGADPNDERINTYVSTHDVIAHAHEVLP